MKEDMKLTVDTLRNHKKDNIEANVENIFIQVEKFLEQVGKNFTEAGGFGGEADSVLMFLVGHGGKVKGVDCSL